MGNIIGQHSLGVKFSHRIGFQIIGYYKNIFTSMQISLNNLSCQGIVHFSAS